MGKRGVEGWERKEERKEGRLRAAQPYGMAPSVRIVGGDVQRQVVPWIASMQRLDDGTGEWSHICGGSLVSPSHVLTAAHCVDRVRGSVLRVVIGALNQQDLTSASNAQGPVIVAEVNRSWVHPQYKLSGGSKFDVDNDLGLLQLSTAVTSVQPVRLNREPLLEQVPQNLVVSGWGRLSSFSGNETTPDLMSVKLPVYSLAACNQTYGIVDSNMFCTLYEGTPGKDSCTGDSGGPAWTCDGNGHGVLVGSVSFGDMTCAKPDGPGVYMSMAHNIEWITTETGYTRPADVEAPNETYCVGSAPTTPTSFAPAPSAPPSSAPPSSTPPSFAPTGAAPTVAQPAESGGGLSSGAIAGIAIGAVLGAALLALLLFKLFAGRAAGGSPSAGAPPGASSVPHAQKSTSGASAPASADPSASSSEMQRV